MPNLQAQEATESQGNLESGALQCRRKGLIMNSDQQGEDVVLQCEVPLNNMFGYSTELRRRAIRSDPIRPDPIRYWTDPIQDDPMRCDAT